MIDEEHQARRRYKKDLAHIKPDLVAYNKQKAIALGVAPDALKPGSSSSAVTAFDPSGGQVCFVSRFHFVSFFFVSPSSWTRARSVPTSDAQPDSLLRCCLRLLWLFLSYILCTRLPLLSAEPRGLLKLHAIFLQKILLSTLLLVDFVPNDTLN